MKHIKKITAIALALAMSLTVAGAPADARISSSAAQATATAGTAAAAKSNIRLSKTSVTLKTGASITLKVKGTTKKATWSTSNKKIATVTQKGKVTAKKTGSAVIRAKVAKKTLKCSVKVTAADTKKTPLSQYWSATSSTAESLRNYVKKVTNPADKDNFIPVKDRIAVFDMDGTLTCETYFTYFDTMMFIDFCLKDHPDTVSEEVKEVARGLAPGFSADASLAMAFAKAYQGMTVDELYAYAEEFGNRYPISYKNMRYFDGFYLPMVELVKYLYENDFTIYVVSGTERTTTRAIIANSPIADYVSPSHIIGTEFEVKIKGYEDKALNIDSKYVPGDQLVFTGGFIQKNLNGNKSIWIQREIGQRPVLAFGNSGTDSSMLAYALDDNPHPAEAYMIVADDPERNWVNQSWEEKSKGYLEQGFTPVSMKNEFVQIYKDGIELGESIV
ncbi:MAG: haloacid dehalogenase-like hydrolase [Eubacterium sp.]|nr:haloacid dehalogenase-like hydrolase [Eubacterium sp.]